MKKLNNDIWKAGDPGKQGRPFTEEELEKFIKENKDKFNIYRPTENHEGKFMVKLTLRLRRAFISIVPYLIKVGTVTLIIWIISIALEYYFKIPPLWDLVINWFKK